jgi:hypothetical protein
MLGRVIRYREGLTRSWPTVRTIREHLRIIKSSIFSPRALVGEPLLTLEPIMTATTVTAGHGVDRSESLNPLDGEARIGPAPLRGSAPPRESSSRRSAGHGVHRSKFAPPPYGSPHAKYDRVEFRVSMLDYPSPAPNHPCPPGAPVYSPRPHNLAGPRALMGSARPGRP